MLGLIVSMVEGVTLSSASLGLGDASISEFLAKMSTWRVNPPAARSILGDWFPLRGQGKLPEPDL